MKVLIKNFAEQLKRKKNWKIQTFLLVVIFGYLMFFTSKAWFPAGDDYVEATAYYTSVIYADYEIYLTQWVYSEEDASMQIIIEKENRGIVDRKFNYTAVEKTKGNLEVVPMLDESGYVVLRINHLPTKWREISLRIKTEEEENPVKFYTNISDVKRVESIPEQTQTAYQTDRLTAQIEYDQVQINEKSARIDNLKEEIKEMTARITELKEDTYLSEKEAEKALDTINRAKTAIKTNQDNIEDLESEIKELEQRTENIQKQIRELKDQ